MSNAALGRTGSGILLMKRCREPNLSSAETKQEWGLQKRRTHSRREELIASETQRGCDGDRVRREYGVWCAEYGVQAHRARATGIDKRHRQRPRHRHSRMVGKGVSHGARYWQQAIYLSGVQLFRVPMLMFTTSNITAGTGPTRMSLFNMQHLTCNSENMFPVHH